MILFDEDVDNDKKENVENKVGTHEKNTEANSFDTLDDMVTETSTVQNSERAKAPIITDEEDSYDLQKELEAKFDELFGPIDEE